MSRFRACPCGSGLSSEWQVDARGIELTRTCLKCHKEKMRVVITDGGRRAAGFKAASGDCVARSIAIVTGRPYREVYDRLAEGNATQRQTKRTRGRRGRTASDGIHVKRKWCQDYLRELGLTWVPLMGIGTGCTVHLRASELPKGRLVVSCSKHWTAVIDGVIHDNHDPSRGGWRCVYGYWVLK